MKFVKSLLVNTLTVMALIVGGMLVAVGYSDHLRPDVHPLVACAGMAMPAAMVLNVAMMLVMLAVKWRRAWIPLAAFVLAYGPIRTYIPLHLASQEEADLRIVSYNVCGYGGNFKYDHALDTITSYAIRQNADIVCIQEEQCIKHKAQERWAELYPYNDTTRVDRDKTGKFMNVLGIHSRLPIIRKERIYYHSSANGSVAYYLKAGHDTIIVINNHLETTHLTKEDREDYRDILKGKKERQQAEEQLFTLIEKLAESMVKRAPEAEVVHTFVKDHKDSYPIIVCGDFNDTPISYTRHTLAKGLTDCFAEAGCGLGLSYNQKGFNFRIDHIFCSTHFKPVTCTVDSKMDASDHYPIVCGMKMNNKH